MEMLRRMFWDYVCFVEVIVSVAVHATFGINMFLRAVWSDLKPDLTSGPQQSARVSPVIEADESEVDNRERSNCVMMRSESGGRNLGYAGSFMEGHEKAPIVLVHGIFGFGAEKLGKISYWGGAEKQDDRIFAPDLGALGSMHDRARELFYYLKGGRVDYGVERSEKYGHSRYGHTYHQGHYPDWDSNHPIHFVGHSSGAQAIRVLQNMLADKFRTGPPPTGFRIGVLGRSCMQVQAHQFVSNIVRYSHKAFPGHNCTSADWILSVTALSGSLNGTTRVFYDGIRPDDGRSMKSFSLLQVLRVGVLVYEWLDIRILKRYYDFGFDHYNLEWHKAGIRGLVNALLNNSGPFAHGNWVLPDLSIQSALEMNKKLKTFDKTFYFSYATQGTKKWFSRWTLPGSILGTHPLLFIRSLQICLWRHPRELAPPYKGYRDEDWQDNDGALNSISQFYPRLPSEHPHCDLGTELNGLEDVRVLQPGIWYYTTLCADHISFIISRERAGVHFDVLYDSIFQRCRKQLRPSKGS